MAKYLCVMMWVFRNIISDFAVRSFGVCSNVYLPIDCMFLLILQIHIIPWVVLSYDRIRAKICSNWIHSPNSTQLGQLLNPSQYKSDQRAFVSSLLVRRSVNWGGLNKFVPRQGRRQFSQLWESRLAFGSSLGEAGPRRYRGRRKANWRAHTRKE